MAERHTRIGGRVYFIGAGPGAVDLITLRGRRLIDNADCIIYAGSLVNPELFVGCRVPLHDSAGLHLDEMIELMTAVVEQGGTVARVHTGDPSLYGAIKEQMVRLEHRGIAYEVVPGVSSAFAAAAALGAELTLPEVTQSVIITRKEGRTPVPDREHLSRLAASGSTMMIFLSVGMIDDVVADLLAGGYSTADPGGGGDEGQLAGPACTQGHPGRYRRSGSSGRHHQDGHDLCRRGLRQRRTTCPDLGCMINHFPMPAGIEEDPDEAQSAISPCRIANVLIDCLPNR
jgi:precorrin-4/cobalt-precorrin-4 C11-methyltransferase